MVTTAMLPLTRPSLSGFLGRPPLMGLEALRGRGKPWLGVHTDGGVWFPRDDAKVRWMHSPFLVCLADCPDIVFDAEKLEVVNDTCPF